MASAAVQSKQGRRAARGQQGRHRHHLLARRPDRGDTEPGCLCGLSGLAIKPRWSAPSSPRAAVAHILQSGDMYGEGEGPIKAEQMTSEVGAGREAGPRVLENVMLLRRVRSLTMQPAERISLPCSSGRGVLCCSSAHVRSTVLPREFDPFSRIQTPPGLGLHLPWRRPARQQPHPHRAAAGELGAGLGMHAVCTAWARRQARPPPLQGAPDNVSDPHLARPSPAAARTAGNPTLAMPHHAPSTPRPPAAAEDEARVRVLVSL